MDPSFPPFSFPARRVATSALLVACLLSGCARHQEVDSKQVRVTSSTGRGRYVVRFEASRSQDHAPLAAVSVPVSAGGKTTVNVRRETPTEQRPTFTSFTAALTPMRSPGLFQLVTKVALREAGRTKKGKLKISKRNQGSLLPIRPGETQAASTANDPVQIRVQLERR